MTRHALSWRDDHVPETMIDRMLNAMGPDTYRARHLDGLDLPLPTGEDREDRIAMQERLSDLLDGLDEKASAAALKTLSALPQHVEATALDMLRATGIDAAIAIVIAYALSRAPDQTWANVRIPSFTLTAGPARGHEAQVSVEQDHRIMIRAPLAPQTYWQDDGVLAIDRPLPNSVCIAMDGRPLRDIVSHPVLDELPIRVEKVSTPIGGQETQLRTDLRPNRLRMSELTLEGTRPDRRTLSVTRPPRRRVDTTPSF